MAELGALHESKRGMQTEVLHVVLPGKLGNQAHQPLGSFQGRRAEVVGQHFPVPVLEHVEPTGPKEGKEAVEARPRRLVQMRGVVEDAIERPAELALHDLGERVCVGLIDASVGTDTGKGQGLRGQIDRDELAGLQQLAPHNSASARVGAELEDALRRNRLDESQFIVDHRAVFVYDEGTLGMDGIGQVIDRENETVQAQEIPVPIHRRDPSAMRPSVRGQWHTRHKLQPGRDEGRQNWVKT